MFKKHILFIACLYTLVVHAYQAVVIVPVADLLGQETKDFDADHTLYYSLPYSPETGKFCCPRIYQLLFNERVEVVEEFEHECKITYNGALYLKDGKPCNEFYTLKKYLTPVTEINEAYLPSTPDFKQGIDSFSENDIVLIEPVTINADSFSAGTRFKLNQNNSDDSSYWVYCNGQLVSVSQEFALMVHSGTSLEDRVALFVRILQLWANNPDGFVPYALGGASNLYYIKNGFPFTLVTTNIADNEKSFWSYHEELIVKSGMDCSALIIRAAQTAGIPFFYRNTTTIETFLENLTEDFTIQPGDIIWFKGHVLVVSDVQNNRCVEARGYAAGFGKVQEIALQDLFEGITTFDDLKAAFLEQRPLQLLDSKKKALKVIDVFKILALTYSLTKIETQLQKVCEAL